MNSLFTKHYNSRKRASTHLPPVILKHHEARLWVSSAGPRGGSVVARSVPRAPGVQPAHPTHTGPSQRPVNNHKNSTAVVPGKKE